MMNGVIKNKIPPEQDRKYTTILEKLTLLLDIPLTRTQLGILLEYMQTTEELPLEEYMFLVNSYRMLYKLDCDNRKAELSDIHHLLEKTSINSHAEKPYIAKLWRNKNAILRTILES